MKKVIALLVALCVMSFMSVAVMAEETEDGLGDIGTENTEVVTDTSIVVSNVSVSDISGTNIDTATDLAAEATNVVSNTETEFTNTTTIPTNIDSTVNTDVSGSISEITESTIKTGDSNSTFYYIIGGAALVLLLGFAFFIMKMIVCFINVFYNNKQNE